MMCIYWGLPKLGSIFSDYNPKEMDDFCGVPSFQETSIYIYDIIWLYIYMILYDYIYIHSSLQFIAVGWVGNMFPMCVQNHRLPRLPRLHRLPRRNEFQWRDRNRSLSQWVPVFFWFPQNSWFSWFVVLVVVFCIFRFFDFTNILYLFSI